MAPLSFLTLAVSLLLCVMDTAQAFSATPMPTKVSSKNVLASNDEAELIHLAKDYVKNRNGFYNPIDKDAHAEDFVFRAGVVGPLNKEDYCDTMTKLGIHKAFDLQSNAFGFCVDPDDPMMVRFFVRYTGTQVNPWSIQNTPINIPVSSGGSEEEKQQQPVAVQGPTEAFCIRFNEEGKVRFFSISNPILFGNPRPTTTGNLGAVLGLFNHLGESVYAKSALNDNVRNLSNFVSRLLGKEMGAPVTKSKEEDLPNWWKGY